MDPKRFLDTADLLYGRRKEDSIKSDFGRSLIIAGSRRYPLCILIASALCYASANGYTALSMPDEIYDAIVSRMNPTQIIEPLENKDGCFLENQNISRLNKYDSILLGNGVEEKEENRKFLSKLIHEYDKHLIIDATGLTLLAKDKTMLKNKNPNSKILLTPHLKEASMLFSCELENRNPETYLDKAISFCKEYQVNILLKSSKSLYVNSQGLYEESTYKPTNNLAKAGSGDGLAGYLCGILAYATKRIGYDESIIFADHMIHIAAYQAKEELGMTSSILDVPSYIQKLTKGK